MRIVTKKNNAFKALFQPSQIMATPSLKVKPIKTGRRTRGKKAPVPRGKSVP